jgi:hypothetical protein
MKFEIIFEDNGTYGAAIKIGSEHIFTVGKDYDDLWKNIKDAVSCAFHGKKTLTQNHKQLARFLHLNDKVYAS